MLSNNREEILNASGSQGSRADVLGNNHPAADDSRIEGKTEWGKKKTVTDKKREKRRKERERNGKNPGSWSLTEFPSAQPSMVLGVPLLSTAWSG